VATFTRQHDAHLLRIKLEGLEIPAVVCDDATASVAPHLTNAIGGIRVQVSDEDFIKAQASLQEEQPSSVDLREGLICPNCGSSDIAQALHEKRFYGLSFLISLSIMIPFPLVKRRYCCNNCTHKWK